MRMLHPYKGILRRATVLLLVLALLCPLTGCGKQQGGALRADLTGRAETLDPQYATGATERCILKNCMEGLLRRLPDGTLTEGVATDYTVSRDHKTYTFTLREDACWSDGEPVTAADFAFAFERMREGSAEEGAAADFAAISGMNGEGEWGIAAPNSRTVVITLSRNDPLLPEKLAEPAAFPCREDIYKDAHARYGNAVEYMVFNGPFTVKEWSRESIKLAKNTHYSGLTPAQSQSVICTLGRSDRAERFREGLSDCSVIDPAMAAKPGKGVTLETHRDGVVLLLLNASSGATADAGVRQALCYGVELLDYAENGRLPEHLAYTTSIVPETARVLEQSYAALTAKGFALGEVTLPDGTLLSDPRRSNQLTFGYDLRRARASLPAANQNGRPGNTAVEGLTLLLPQGSEWMDFAGWLQQQWLQKLNIIVNLEEVDSGTYRSRLAAGQYTLALYQSTAGEALYPVFSQYGKAGDMPVKWEDPRYEPLLQMAASADDVREAVRLFAHAEALLLDAAVAMPLFGSESYFALADGVTGITAGADGSEIFFAGGRRE